MCLGVFATVALWLADPAFMTTSIHAHTQNSAVSGPDAHCATIGCAKSLVYPSVLLMSPFAIVLRAS